MHTLLAYISEFSIFLPLLMMVILSKHLSKQLVILKHFIFFTATLGLASIVLGWVGIQNLFLYHLHTPIEVILLSLFYFRISQRIVSMNGLIFIGITILSFAFIDVFFISGLENLNGFTRVFGGIFILTLAFRYIHYFLAQRSLIGAQNNPYFLITIGLIIYYVGTTALFTLNNSFLQASNDALHLVWIAHTYTNILLNLIITLAIWKQRKLRLA